jgi:transketolase
MTGQIPLNKMYSSAHLNRLRYRIMEVNSISGEGHILSSLSVLEMILAVVNVQRKSYNLNPPEYIWSDPFVLSKGHAALAFYVVMEDLDLLDPAELDRFGAHQSRFGGHVDARKSSLAYFSTGSLGHGLPVAIGAALQLSKSDSEATVYCICGDGEFMEGAMWEALSFASQMKLKNLRILVDCNSTHGAQGFGQDALFRRLRAFGNEVRQINGHNLNEITKALHKKPKLGPSVILCKTNMGNGVSLVQGKKEWHRRVISADDLLMIKKELEMLDT